MKRWTQLKGDTVPEYVIGAYATNRPNGIRSVPYSTDHSVNSLMYSTIQTLNEVHGTVFVFPLRSPLLMTYGRHR